MVQEQIDGAWQHMVGVIFLNQTGRAQVKQILPQFLERWPTPESLLRSRIIDIEDVIKPLGMWRRRAMTLYRMSLDFLSWDGENAKDLHGIGLYGDESYRIFFRGERFEPDDKELRAYLGYPPKVRYNKKGGIVKEKLPPVAGQKTRQEPTPPMTPDELRDGIFALNTRKFGSVAEIMIKQLQSLGKAKSIFHDLYDNASSSRIEVKFSTVRQNLPPIDPRNVLESIRSATSADRSVPFAEWQAHRFLCNIQQVKRAEFDVLYYGMFFHDCIKIFRIIPDQIGPSIKYGDKQHKGNEGEGQFHITEKTLQTHIDNHYHATLTYQQLLDLLSP